MKKIIAALACAFLSPIALARPQLEVAYVTVSGESQVVEVGQPDVVALEFAIEPDMEIKIASTELATCERIATKIENGNYYVFFTFEPEIDSGFNSCVAEITSGGKLIHTVSFGVSIDD